MLGLLVIIYWFAGESTAVLPEPKFYESSCYGVADKYVDFQFKCTSNDSSIAVSSVIAAVKPLTKNCSDVKSSGINSEYHERCCTVDRERDCNATYHNTNDSLTYEIQSVCNGYQKCPSPVKTLWMRVGCNNTVYPPESNYMIVDYFCIKKSKIAALQSTNKSLKGIQSVYLQSAGYPCDSNYSNDEEWCQVEVSDTAIPIQVVAIDIQLAENASIVFKEAQSCKESEYKITYENNNKYQILNIFNLTNTVFLSYKTGRFSSGRFWIGFVSYQNISITCGVTINENCTTKLLLNRSTLNTENIKPCSANGGITSSWLQTTNPNKKNTSTTDKNHYSTIDSTTNSTIANYKYQSPGSSTESTTTAYKYHNPGSSSESTTTANKDHNPRSSSESTTTAYKYHNPRSSSESTTTANKDHNPRSSTESRTSNKNHNPRSSTESRTTSNKDHNPRSSTESRTTSNKNHNPRSSTESTTTANKDHNPRSSTESTTTANKDHSSRSSTESTTTANKDHNPRSSTESTTTAYKDHNPSSSTESTTTVYKYPKTSFSKEGITVTKKYHSPVYSTHGTKNYKNHSLDYFSFSTRTTYRNHSPSISSGSTKTTYKNQSLSSSADSTRTTNKNSSSGSSPGSTKTTYKNNRPPLSKDSTTTYKNPRSGPPSDSTTTTSKDGTSTTNNNTAKAGNSSSQKSSTETPPTNNNTTKDVWWIALMVGVPAFIMIGGLVYKYKKRQRKVSDVNTKKDTSPEDAFFVTPDEKNLIPPSQTTIDIFIPEKRNNVLPKIEEKGVHETESIPEKKSKKKKKKRKKKSKRREETDVPDDNLSNKDNF